MKIEEVKRNMGKTIRYKDSDGYMLIGCILRKGEDGFFYQAELLDKRHGNSVIICNLKDVEGLE